MIQSIFQITNFDTLTKRIEILEKSNRRLRLIAIAATLAITIFIFIGADKTSRTLEAQKIVLLDSHGHARLTISTPAIAGAAIGLEPDDPAIWLSNNDGTDRATLSTNGLFFSDNKLRPTITLSTDSTGISRLQLYGKDGKVTWSAP